MTEEQLIEHITLVTTLTRGEARYWIGYWKSYLGMGSEKAAKLVVNLAGLGALR